MTADSVRVGLGTRAYDIVIGEGLLERAGELLRPHLARDRVFIVTDRNVRQAQGKRLSIALKRAGLQAEAVVLAPGEPTKSVRQLERLLNKLSELGAERGDLILAFGGGVVGDLAGFAAAIYQRGCRYAQAPTTLLAQVDSAVGGKTGINIAAGKNLAGAFHQPVLVVSDIGALSTLPDREMRAGYAEIVKYGALGDAAFFDWLVRYGGEVLARQPAALMHAIKRSCEMKAAIVVADEREAGRRALLNLGHTFGHALEAAAGYSDRLLHGEAVAAGMGLAFDYSASMGVCEASDAERLKAHLRACGLPAGLEGPAAGLAAPADFLKFMRADKKSAGGSITLILARRLGEAIIAAGADPDAILKFLEAKTAERA
ncbi:MAG: 3-dehydroquinate synthase [Parvularculaceae bacterium]